MGVAGDLHQLFFFFFNDTATTEIYTLSLHDALPILLLVIAIIFGTINVVGGFLVTDRMLEMFKAKPKEQIERAPEEDRKSTRLNSSHANISYAVFCLKKKKSHSIT